VIKTAKNGRPGLLDGLRNVGTKVGHQHHKWIKYKLYKKKKKKKRKR